jgi:hypothetical protein
MLALSEVMPLMQQVEIHERRGEPEHANAFRLTLYRRFVEEETQGNPADPRVQLARMILSV